jgi:hypothetical protein
MITNPSIGKSPHYKLKIIIKIASIPSLKAKVSFLTKTENQVKIMSKFDQALIK